MKILFYLSVFQSFSDQIRQEEQDNGEYQAYGGRRHVLLFPEIQSDECEDQSSRSADQIQDQFYYRNYFAHICSFSLYIIAQIICLLHILL